MLGINNESHFRASSLDKWNGLGDKLAPKTLWLDLFNSPGMQTLEIRQVPRCDGQQGYTQVKIEPSVQVTPGVYIAVNDHFECGPTIEFGATKIMILLQEKWAESTVFAEKVFSRIAEEL
jgi:hypothetical protein